jgi:hypothetical protein
MSMRAHDEPRALRRFGAQRRRLAIDPEGAQQDASVCPRGSPALSERTIRPKRYLWTRCPSSEFLGQGAA